MDVYPDPPGSGPDPDDLPSARWSTAWALALAAIMLGTYAWLYLTS